jgi:hypothetical protein
VIEQSHDVRKLFERDERRRCGCPADAIFALTSMSHDFVRHNHDGGARAAARALWPDRVLLEDRSRA